MQKDNQTSFSANKQNTAVSGGSELSQTFNYPALEELFADGDLRNAEAFRVRLKAILQDLERIIRRGTKDEADSAMRSAKGIEVSLRFIEELSQKRITEGK